MFVGTERVSEEGKEALYKAHVAKVSEQVNKDIGAKCKKFSFKLTWDEAKDAKYVVAYPSGPDFGMSVGLHACMCDVPEVI